VQLTEVQKLAYETTVSLLENEFSLPAEARAFLPLVKQKLLENLARTSDEVIVETLEKLLDRTENTLIAMCTKNPALIDPKTEATV
jgi:hypothetical protein